MDSRLLTMMAGHTGHFGVRRRRYPSPCRNSWDPRSSRGWPGATCPPPLWMWRFTGPQLGLAVRGKRRRRGASGSRRPGSGQTPLVSPSAEVRFGRAALPAHSKTVRNP